jgi:HSP20 family molecular chaperone IbpA
MLLLRRGRTTPSSRPRLDVDVVFAVQPTVGRQNGGCRVPWRPPTEVFETEAGLVVRAELAGVVDSQLHVVADREELTIRGERSVLPKGDARLYHESRIDYGPFDVTVRFPFPVDVRAATADYTDGMLTVRLPRLAATTITAGAGSDAAGAGEGSS